MCFGTANVQWVKLYFEILFHRNLRIIELLENLIFFLSMIPGEKLWGQEGEIPHYELRHEILIK